MSNDGLAGSEWQTQGNGDLVAVVREDPLAS